MTKFNLQQNESVMLTETNICYVNTDKRLMEDELVLTNKRIVYINKGFWGNKKGEQSFPLGGIKMFNGAPCVSCVKSGGYTDCLEVVMNDGTIQTFCFHSASTVIDWINAIFRVLTGHPSELIYKEKTGWDGFWTEMKEAFTGERSGIQKRSKEDFRVGVFAENEGVNHTMRCISCRAPLSGVIGDIIKCDYCDTKQTIKEKK